MTTSGTAAASPQKQGSARLKGLMILGVLAVSGLVFLAWSQSWGSLSVTSDGGSSRILDVPGATAAPALAALGLAGLASAAALAIAGPVIRIVLGILQVLLGASIVLSGTGPLIDPVSAGSPVVTAATGVAGTESIRTIARSEAVTAWPVVAILLGALLALLGVAVAVTTTRWPVSGRRYQAVRFASEDGRVLEADELLDLDGSAGSADAPSPDADESPDDAAVRRKAASVDNWDSLSRGTDPTA
ncbi:Trp biosynthesis-associated membrane protein [Agreia pratensis]|uniref:Trp biosynthesis-associated membrane protein n=1 Tax=Agreia pratensis TaxID=150121 RepID=UPI00188B3270|nr:Trp biosynthesis-associated membrane protein [Agreia pratensis]MBF4634126.1 Trp biosynthesis-associated membrane protein [Agreia pratensis]